MFLIVLALAILAGGLVVGYLGFVSPGKRLDMALAATLICTVGAGFLAGAVWSMRAKQTLIRSSSEAATIEVTENLYGVAVLWLLLMALSGFVLLLALKLMGPVWQHALFASVRFGAAPTLSPGALLLLSLMAACFYLGGWAIWYYVKRVWVLTSDVLHFGQVRLELDSWPLRIGAPLRGHLLIGKNGSLLTGVVLELGMIRHVWRRGMKSGELSHDQATTIAATLQGVPNPGLPGGAFEFSGVIPRNWPATNDPTDVDGPTLEFDRTYFTWEIRIREETGSRASLNRTFVFRVEAAH